MPLTPAQITSLTGDLGTNTATIVASDGATVQIRNISAQQKNSDTAFAVAAWYNQLTVSFWGYYRSVPIQAIKGAITWKRLTPQDAIPTDTALNVAIWQAHNDLCAALKASVMALMSMGLNGTLDCTPNNVVQGFNDALSAVPSGASGATQDAGWSGASGVRPQMCRLGTNAEKLFASTTNGTGTDNTHAASFGPFEGVIQGSDVTAIWGV